MYPLYRLRTRASVVCYALMAFAVAGLVACGGGGDGRMPVTSMTVFGDSLSDVGTYRVATGDPANPGKFTVNPAPIWVDLVAAHYGQTLSPNRSLRLDAQASMGATNQPGTATVIGGNGYAEGGARVTRLPSESGIGNNQLVAPVATQVSHYLTAHGSFPGGQLVILGGGGNDVFAQFSALCWGTDDNGAGSGNTTIASATANVTQAAKGLVTQLLRIKSSGGEHVLVYGAGDWSSTPFGQYYLSATYQSQSCYTAVTPGQVSAWIHLFNQTVLQGIANLPGVVYLDTTGVLTAAANQPAQYGLTNTTQAACTNTKPTAAAVFCTRATLATPDADQTYLYSDNFHPSPKGHAILASAALAALNGMVKPGN